MRALSQCLLSLSRAVCGKIKRNVFTFPHESKNVKVDTFPWMVSIISVAQVKDETFKSLLCIGTLINDRDILTSATCVHLFLPQELLVSLSSQPTSLNASLTPSSSRGHRSVSLQVPVRSITVHPSFVKSFATSGRVLKNDIAVLRLASPVDVENDDVPIVPVCLHEKSHPSNEKLMTLTGWQYPAPGSSSALGKVTSDSSTSIDLIPSDECKRYFSRIVDIDSSTITCTPTPSSVCYLEKGSPLLFEYSSFTYQYALVSLSREVADCAIRKNKVPTVLITIHPYLQWIKEVTHDAHWCWAPYQAFT